MSIRRNQKGIFPIIIRTERVKAAQLEETRSVETTPPKRKESVYSIPFSNTDSQQSLYLKEILTRLLGKKWKGFNSRIKV